MPDVLTPAQVKGLRYRADYYAAARVRVERGARMLDQCLPDWEREVEGQMLDMGDGYSCLLGHAYGSFTDGLRQLFDCMDEAPMTAPIREGQYAEYMGDYRATWAGCDEGELPEALCEGDDDGRLVSYGLLGEVWHDLLRERGFGVPVKDYTLVDEADDELLVKAEPVEPGI